MTWGTRRLPLGYVGATVALVRHEVPASECSSSARARRFALRRSPSARNSWVRSTTAGAVPAHRTRPGRACYDTSDRAPCGANAPTAVLSTLLSLSASGRSEEHTSELQSLR